MTLQFKRSDAVVLLAALAWLAATLGLRPLMLPDEGRYAGVAWEMLRSGDWVTPTLAGLPYFHKPPLFYWITAAAMSVLGMHEWAARVAPWFGGALGAVSLYVFALRWMGREKARWALGAFVTMPLVFFSSQFANLDMLVAGCMAMTILALAHAVLAMREGTSPRNALIAAYAGAALGVLAKGLIGVVLPGMVIVLWVLVLRSPRLLLHLVWWPGLVLFLAVTAPWFIANEVRHPGFAHYFIVVQHFQRYANTGFNNAQPVWFFAAVLLATALPWSLWLVSAAHRRFWQDPQAGAARSLMWLWLLAITVFFSIPQSKLVGYILPVTIPLALLAGDACAGAASAWRGLSLRRLSAVLGVLFCALAIAIPLAAPGKSHRAVALAMQGRVGPQDAVIFLHEYYFDVPFYARLPHPPAVVTRWNNAKETGGDNWHRELLDGVTFDAAAGQRTLLFPAQFQEAACGAPAAWVIGKSDSPLAYPLLKRAERVVVSGDEALWRVTCGPAHSWAVQ